MPDPMKEGRGGEGVTRVEEQPRVAPYKIGICFASVCAAKDVSVEEIEREVNLAHPTGLDHGWKFSREDHFTLGETNPCRCNTDPDRLHFLLDC